MKTVISILFLLVLFQQMVFAQPKQPELPVNYDFHNSNLPLEERTEILVSQMTNDEKINQLVNGASAIPRLGILEYDWWNEALHGIARNGKATVFPQAIGLGATFDPILAKRVASAISTEARAKFSIAQKMENFSKYAGLTFWTPNVNIFRDPRWGRGQETYGEDPYLMSRIGVAFVQGLQGDDPQYLKTAACAKHFAVHSGPEESRHHFNATPSKQDLHETYFPAFEALVKEAKVEGVMAAYNAVYGEPACANPFLLDETLRKEWGFDGYITSDCGAVSGVAHKQHFVSTPTEAAAAALNAGTNLNCGGTYKNLAKALKEGLITEELLHERTKQLFKTRFRLGMMDNASENPYSSISANKIHCDEHVALAKEVAQKSIVLLKNKNNTLPLSKEIKIPYITGPFANSSDMLIGNYYGVSPNLVTVLEGVVNTISLGSSLNYRSGTLPFQKNLNPLNWAPKVAAQSDATICVVGITADMEGEEVDAIAAAHRGDRPDLKLPKSQIDYVKEIAQCKKGPLVLVVASGSPVSLEGIEEHCDAILQIWYPGEQGGNAVADVLFGNVSPSGHLPLTFPKNIEQLPAYDDYSMTGRTYKYMKEEPLFPFGFGLTYSKTKLTKLTVSDQKIRKGENIEIEIEVSNIGNYDIDEVVQCYVSPSDCSGGIPQTSLKAFRRVNLKKGEKKIVQFSLPADKWYVINEEGEKEWRKGKYTISVGNSSPGERSVELGACIPASQIVQLM